MCKLEILIKDILEQFNTRNSYRLGSWELKFFIIYTILLLFV